MHKLLARLGNPHNALPVVHVAGSKGKGSVTAMLAAMLQAARYRVGTYTRRALPILACEHYLCFLGCKCSTHCLVCVLKSLLIAARAAMSFAALNK